MSWFKVDDTLAAHQKVRRAGVPAMGMWVLSGSYAAQQLTDGFVPEWFVLGFPGGRKYAQSLVTAGLWSEAVKDGENGWLFHDWKQANPLREQVLKEREAAKKRQASWRESRRDDAVSHGVTDGVTNGVSNAAPTRPDPTRREEELRSSSPKSADPPRTDVEGLCRYMHAAVTAIGVKATIGEKWRDSARLMLDKDERDQHEIRAVIDWTMADPFWKANVHSVPKLRDKYDQLRLGMQRARPVSTGNPATAWAREQG